MLSTEEFYMIVDTMGLLVVATIFLGERSKLMTTQNDEQRVHAMLDDAVANGYDITGWTVEDIVLDIQAYAELEESDTPEALTLHVTTWKMKRTSHAS